jgi:hypothetical protein
MRWPSPIAGRDIYPFKGVLPDVMLGGFRWSIPSNQVNRLKDKEKIPYFAPEKA